MHGLLHESTEAISSSQGAVMQHTSPPTCWIALMMLVARTFELIVCVHLGLVAACREQCFHDARESSGLGHSVGSGTGVSAYLLDLRVYPGPEPVVLEHCVRVLNWHIGGLGEE